MATRPSNFLLLCETVLLSGLNNINTFVSSQMRLENKWVIAPHDWNPSTSTTAVAVLANAEALGYTV